jgi:hypothetical protein
VPLAKLNSLSLKKNALLCPEFSVAITPGLQELLIYGNRNCEVHVPTSSPINTTMLRILSFRGVNIDLAELKNPVRSDYLRSVEVLGLEYVGCRYSDFDHDRPWLSYNYSGLKQAIRVHFPRFKVFIWSEMRYDNLWNDALVPFGSFAEFDHLEHLVIDYNLLVDNINAQHSQDEAHDFLDFVERFPKALQSLELDAIGWYLMKKVYEDYLDASDAQPDMLLGLIPFFLALPFKTICIGVCMNGWPHQAQHKYTQAFAQDEPVVHLLRSLVDMLQEVGVYLSLHYYMDSTYEVPRRLVGPNYTVKELCYDVYIHALNQREIEARDAELVANASGVMVVYQAEVVNDDS